jgi:hypothetical protein
MRLGGGLSSRRQGFMWGQPPPAVRPAKLG